MKPGDSFAQYEIQGPIGAGGMGEVFMAHDTKLRRDVAVKILPPGFAADKERIARSPPSLGHWIMDGKALRMASSAVSDSVSFDFPDLRPRSNSTWFFSSDLPRP